MELRRRAVAGEDKIFPKERPPARFRHPGAEYTLNPFRPARGFHVGPKRGRSDPITYISAKELRAMDDPRTSAVEIPYERSLDVAKLLNDVLPRQGIRSPAQVAAFVAQAMTESRDFSRLEEDLYYRRPGRLRELFPSRFPTDESEIPYRRNPEAMANYVYATRNGNRMPGDGFRYRGRGPLQITGRDNYRLAGFEANPDALDDVASGFDASSRWWSAQNLPQRTSSWLEREGFDGVTRTVNGDGMTEADARWADYRRARAAMAWRDPRGRRR